MDHGASVLHLVGRPYGTARVAFSPWVFMEKQLFLRLQGDIPFKFPEKLPNMRTTLWFVGSDHQTKATAPILCCLPHLMW